MGAGGGKGGRKNGGGRGETEVVLAVKGGVFPLRDLSDSVWNQKREREGERERERGSLKRKRGGG